ncbi:hypothetical protein M9Y10_021449 [Tritrichomonas musculus]|uniref:Uncharacterized protein n=1 Tax=Tritrichomonas musculus TaxID=1915356 RepID=A0ABR2HEV5_9EUKA
MLFVLLYICVIEAKKQIWVCNVQCPIYCKADRYIETITNSSFKDFFFSHTRYDSEIELIFYSKPENFTFEVDSSIFGDLLVTLKTSSESNSIKILYKDRLLPSFKTIDIKPNYQVILPYMIPFQSTKTNMNILDSRENTPLPTPAPDTSVLTNPQGLINITCDKFNYSQWGSGICVENSIADHGSYTSTNGAKATVTFIGTKVHLLAHKEINAGSANIWIDDKIVGSPNFISSNNNEAAIIFTSDDLDYGEHTFSIEHNGIDPKFIVFASIYVDPLPKEGGFILGLEDADDSSGIWTKNTTTSPPVFSSDDEGAYITFKFIGTRFWITGVRGRDEGDFRLNIDDQETIMIDEKQESGFAQNNMPVLLYQSSDLEYTEHRIKISRTSYKISLVNVMYKTYPYDIIATEPATGNYNDTQYLNDNRISSTKFTATTTGDQSGHPIEHAFDSSSNTFWISSIANNDTFQSTIEFEFTELTTIEAIVICPVFSTDYNSTGNPIARRYDGFPTTLKVYASTDDGSYKLHSVFNGTPKDIYELFQFVFKRAITCNKLKLEFTEVTLDVSFGNEYTAACVELYLIPTITPAATPLPTPLGYPMITLVNYSDEGYWSSYRINDRSNWIVTANSEQTTEAGIEGPVTNIIDGQRETIWHSQYNGGQVGSHDDRPQATDPFQFTIDLGQETTFRAFSYTPRQNRGSSGSQNGIFLHYEFYVADTKDELDTKIQERNYISNGDFEYTSQVSSTDLTSLVIYPEPKIGRFIALLSVNHDGYATCSEFNLYSDPPATPHETPLPSATPLPPCNERIEYSFESDNLIISGIGPMCEYTPEDPAPWISNSNLIKNVMINEGITTIGSYAFQSCTNLATITLPSSLEEIGSYSFSYCTSLISINIPGKVTIIKDRAFSHCNYLSNIEMPNSVSYIGEYAFESDYGILSFTFPEKVTVIEEGVFAYSNIHTVTFLGNVTTIRSSAFYFNSLESISIPESVSTIGSSSFSFCKLETFEFPEKVTIIERDVISYNSRLLSVTFLGNVTAINNNAFRGCSKLQQITIPESVTYIGSAVFSFCYCLESIRIPKNVNNLDLCFVNNPDLIAVYYFGSESPTCQGSLFSETSVKFVYVLPEYSDDNFCGFPIMPFPGTDITYSIESDELIISGTGAMYDYSPNCNNTAPWYANATIIRSVTIHEGITTIGSYSFYMFSNFETITIPQSIISIRPCVFSNCTKMTSFQIPKTITILERGLFVGCSSLVSINIHENVSQIESKVFASCTSMETFLLPEGLEMLGSYAFYQCSKLKSISIPEKITIIEASLFRECSMLDSYVFKGNITEIHSYSFCECYQLQNISLHESLTEIGEYAFYNCHGLLSISIPEKVTKIDNNVFGFCDSLQTVEFLGNITSIRSMAFISCASLLSIDFPPSVETIEPGAFYRCNSLTYFEFPEKVTYIHPYVLKYCDNLISVSFLGNVTTIDYEAFYYCQKISEITIPESVTKIEYSAFSYCTSLTSITLPKNINHIGNECFRYCSSLSAVYYLGSNSPSYGSNLFTNTSVACGYVLPEYQDSHFCGLPVSLFPTQVFSETRHFSDSFVFSSTSQFTRTSSFIASLKFTESSAFTGSSSFTGSSIFTSTSKFSGSSIFSSTSKFSGSSIFSSTSKFSGSSTFTPTSKFSGSSSFSQSSRFTESSSFSQSSGFTESSSFSQSSRFTESSSFTPSSRFTESFSFSQSSGFTESSSFTPSSRFTESSSFSQSSGFTESSSFTPSSRFTESSSFSQSSRFTESSSFSQSSRFTESSSFTLSSRFTESFSFSQSSRFTTSEKFTNSFEFTPSSTFIYDFSGSCGTDLTYGSLSNELIISGTGAMNDYSFDLKAPWSDHIDDIKVITIKEGVTTIGAHAFDSCSLLDTVTISKSVTSIGPYAFNNCYNLRSIEVPEEVTKIESYCFYGCSNLLTIIIIGQITEIGDNAFHGCTILENILFPMSSYSIRLAKDQGPITFPTSLETIGSGSFYGCEQIQSIEIPRRVTIIQNETFSGCIRLSSVLLHSNIKSIEERAFYNCSQLNDVSLPSNLETLGSYAFSECTSLQTMTIPQGITVIETGLFYRCTKLGSIRILGNVSSIKSSAFYHCDVLPSINLPSDLSEIESSAFENCNSLTSITIPERVTTINDLVFHYCYALSSVTFLGNVTNIGTQAFASCTGLQTFTFPESLTTLGANAFYFCRGLQTIFIPKNVNFIGDSCFSQCSLLSSVTYDGLKNPSHGSFVLDNTRVGKVNVPPKYEDDDFCGCSVNYISTTTFSASDIFTDSSAFTASSIFTSSKSFTESSLLGPLEPIASPLATLAGITISESVSYIESFVSVRSVTQKMSYVSSQGYSYILLANGEYSLTSSNVYVYKRIPYVIYYLSPTYIKTGILLEMNVRKKTITQEQLIGVVCGSVAAFFLILAIIVFVVQRKNRIHEIYDEVDWFSSESGDVSDEHTQEIDETVNSTPVYTHFEI